MLSVSIEGFRLSPQQKHLWSLMQNSDAYRSQCTISISGNLDVEFLKSVCQEIGDRYEILRTNFQARSGMKFPLQVISDSCDISWQTIDLSALTKAEQREAIAHLKSTSNTLQVWLVYLEPKQYLLKLDLPSLCADSVSLKNIFIDIASLYNSLLHGQNITEEVVQYLQFSEWQNELLEDEDASIGRNYWQQQPSFDLVNLNFEEKCSHSLDFSPDVYTVNLDADLAEKLTVTARKLNATTAELLFALWQTLIYRIAGKSNFAIAAQFDGRSCDELSRCVGLLAKYLPIGIAWRDDLKMSEVISQLQQTWQQHEQWQEYFLWEETHSNLGFEFQELPNEYSIPNLTFKLETIQSHCDRFKIKLSSLQQATSLTLQLHYDRQLFNRDKIEYLAAQFTALLLNLTDNLETRISELNILSDRQISQLVLDFNQTAVTYPQDKLIHQLFAERVQIAPDAIAIVFGDRQLTYREVNTRTDLLAKHLQQLGVTTETIVGIYLERSPEVVIALLAILKAGGAYLPIDPALPMAGLVWRLQDARSPLLLTQTSLTPNLPELPTQIVYLDEEWESTTTSNHLSPHPTPNNLAYVIYTSGSTGKPKGVAVEHRQIFNYVQGMVQRLNLPAESSYATVSTFAADLGNTAIFAALCTGGCLHIIPQDVASDPAALADYGDRHPIDCLKIVPSHLTTLLANSASAQIIPRQCLVLGGEVASWELIEQIQAISPDCQIINHYGPTETTVGVLTYTVKERRNDAATVPIGRPLPNTQAYILDRHLKPVSIGSTGELYIGGSPVSRGYLHQPELTAEKFILNPFISDSVGAQSLAPQNPGSLRNLIYKTGDLARYLSDGNIEFLGREDNQVKIRGFRVELGEIEAALSQHPQVQQVAVSAWSEKPGDRSALPQGGNRRLVAYIVTSLSNKLTMSELRSYLADKLPEYAIPSILMVMKALPLTPNGKIDRHSLPIPNSDRTEPESTYIAPRGPIEAQMAEIWAQVLGLERVSIHDNFFELGGHSLLLTQLLVKVRESFHTDLSLSVLFASPTVASLAEKIDPISQLEPDRKFTPNWEREIILDSDIYPSQKRSEGDRIFLTGATGFLGAFLLSELLQQTSSNIYCLVRSPNIEAARNKLQNTLEFYLLWEETFSSRIMPVLGDLSQPYLGLSQPEFDTLAKAIDVIYHNGAWVHHTSDYFTLKAANVLGTKEVLRLACQTQTKPVHFISTTSVFSSNNSEITLIKETDKLGDRPPNANGYVQSKWVAEKLVNVAIDRGLPVSIYRPGRISGHSQTGAFNPNDFLYRLIIGCIQLGSIPQDSEDLDLAPVDYVSRAIAHLSKQPKSLGKAFHLVNPNLVSLSSILKLIRSFGYSITEVSDAEWQTKILEIARSSPEHSLYPLVPFFVGNDVEIESTNLGAIAFDFQNVIDGLTDTSISCPLIDEPVLQAYINRLVESGYISAK
jgi:amino acid adenylation domain-containing protein/thioester reductase-like protein